jgi:cysteine-rich repeat protein
MPIPPAASSFRDPSPKLRAHVTPSARRALAFFHALAPTLLGAFVLFELALPAAARADAALDAVRCQRAIVKASSAFKSACLDGLAVPGLKAYDGACNPPPTPTPTVTPTATPTPTLTPTPTTTATPPAGPAASGCQRTIVKEASKLGQTRLRQLRKCAERKLKGSLPDTTDCAAEPKTAAKIATAESKLGALVARACGGGNRTCDPFDAGADADEPLPTIGWSLAECPGLVGGDCATALVDCNDIAACLACVQGAATDQAAALTFDLPPSDDTALARCRKAVRRESEKLFTTRATLLQKCADAILRGAITGPCPEPGDGKTAGKLAQARAKLVDRLCKDCGGNDRACGGGDDLAPAAIGFPAACPAVAVPGGAACGGAVGDLPALVDCVACTTAFFTTCADHAALPGLTPYPAACNPAGMTPTPTPTATVPGATPTGPTATPTPSGAVCGNGIQEAGEDCDDGNTAGCDACPADCRTAVAPCTTDTTRHSVTLVVTPPPFVPMTGADLCLVYPDGTVSLPGTGSVTGRLTFNGFASLNDSDRSVQVSASTTTPQSGLTLSISFDLCVGSGAPPPSVFACQVRSASDDFNQPIDPDTVSCVPQ